MSATIEDFTKELKTMSDDELIALIASVRKGRDTVTMSKVREVKRKVTQTSVDGLIGKMSKEQLMALAAQLKEKK